VTAVVIAAICVAAIPLAARALSSLRRANEEDQRERQARHDAWVASCFKQLRSMRKVTP